MTMASTAPGDAARRLLRHALATLAYRGGKAIRDVPADFGDRKFGERTRTPLEILSHIGDLMAWGQRLASGDKTWADAPLGSWDEQVARFFDELARFDERLASAEPLACSEEQLFQGPIADALTHVGQIAILRGMASAPVRGENYFKAEIEVGRVGPEQSDRRIEFD